MATLGIKVGRHSTLFISSVVRGAVDPDLDPGEHAILYAVSEVDELGGRGRRSRLPGESTAYTRH
jgi:hypothetical protein